MSESDSKPPSYRSETLAVRAGQVRSHEAEHSEAIFTTSSYVFENAAQAAALFAGEIEGNVYSRYTNPTVRTFEQRIAALEGGEAGVATASGMAAIFSIVMALLKQGDHIVCSRDVFGSTSIQLDKYFGKMGVQTTYVSLTDLDAWRSSIQPNTRLMFVETPSNPLCEVADIAALSALANQHGAKLVVDNCFATPALQQPLALGAHLVMHSATKYIDGQGRCVGGSIVGAQDDINEIVGFLRSCGPSMSPFNAWVFLKGLETLGLRMARHSDNALALAQWLQAHPKVSSVNYAGLPSHPSHALASQQMSGFSGVLSFDVGGNRARAWQVIDACELLSLTANLGDAKTTIVHPATTTHGRLSDERRLEAGITDSLIRVSVGLEHVEDIKSDLSRGLDLL